MSSEESDDEPLSVLATNKKENPEKYAEFILPDETVLEPKRKKKKFLSSKGLTVSILQKKFKTAPPPVIERPSDVWLYLKDLNPTGPYSCLLCPEWFINRSKMIIHYILNHKKDFCGICRYFVTDRNAWCAHLNFHTPKPCSQCVMNFETEADLRLHLSSEHKLVHCRLCHFRIPDNDQYNTHLNQKHNVTNVSSKNEAVLWELEYEGSAKFLCLLCSKSNNPTRMFFSHYMGFHHFTLKCFTALISGRDPPFLIEGADLSAEFIETQLKRNMRFGYVDSDKPPDCSEFQNFKIELELKPYVKEEALSDLEDEKCNDDGAVADDENDVRDNYSGDEDFDVTLMELVMVKKCYFEYVDDILNNIHSNTIPENSTISYEKVSADTVMKEVCALCKTNHDTEQAYGSHMSKMHSVQIEPTFSCRVCTSTFDTQTELENHIGQEMGDFEDLWLCQFCDKEFDNRVMTRVHLMEHLDMIEFDNCFSPHLGFKCRYCPSLFWNETDRETHQVEVHLSTHKEDFYKCESCNLVFSDKIWFSHHYINKHKNDDDKGPDPICLFKCCVCCFVAPSVKAMRGHFNANHPEAKKIFCSLEPCQYKPLRHKKSFKLHLKTIHDPASRPDRPVNCTLCNREFINARAYRAHIGQAHGTGKFKCKLCREALRTMDERKLHYLIRHPGQHPFECKQCGKSFQYKSSLYVHKQQHMPNRQSYTCEYCKKTFLKKDSYREHLLIHEGPRHACSYCPMRFVQRSNMLRHERRHTGERPYACPHCSRTFADKGACTSHVRTHSKESAFGCMYCGQTFVQKSKLTYHIRKHTGENLETCSVCSKLFTSVCALREHMKVHEPKKNNVKCPLCDRSYQDERYMLRHLRSSHTRHQHPCPVCRKTLTSAVGLRHHVLTHSKLNTYRCKTCQKGYSVKKSILRHLRRRHGLKGTEINIKDFYSRLDPRECELGLDEEVMTAIYGPPKKIMNDVLIGSFVTVDKKLKFVHKKPDNNKGSDEQVEENSAHSDNDNRESDKDSDGHQIEPICMVKVEKLDSDNDDNELEPTDFVSVKIEPMDEDEAE